MKDLLISIRPCAWYDELHHDESLSLLKEGGFNAIDFSFRDVPIKTFDKGTHTTFFDQSIEEICTFYEPLKKALLKHNMCLAQVHGSDLISPEINKEKSDCFLRAAMKQIEICRYLGCSYIVFHFLRDLNATKEIERTLNLNVFRQLIPIAKQCGVKICLENLYKHVGAQCEDAAGSDAVESAWYIDALNEEAGEVIFGACVDTGHAHLLRRNLYKHIITLGNRVFTLHINENQGREDTHMIPYTQLDIGEQSVAIDWERFLKALKEIGFKGTISFEIKHGLEMLPAACRREGLQLVSSIGRYFREKISN